VEKSSGLPKSTVILLTVFLVVIPVISFASVPAIIGQDDPGLKNSPVVFNVGEKNKMSQGHQVNVNVTTGNLVVKHTDLVIPAIGQDIVIERTYNSLDKVNGIEHGFEVFAGYVWPNHVIQVSPGVVWINGERVKMAESDTWLVDMPTRGYTSTFYVYVRNVGNGIGEMEYVEYTYPGSMPVDRYYLGAVIATSDDVDTVDYIDHSVSFSTGVIHGAKITGHEYGGDSIAYDLSRGLVAINGKKYEVDQLNNFHTEHEPAPWLYFYLEPSTATSVE